jgi:shikimate kinase
MTNKPSNPGHVFLIGPMGAGKSTIGVPLAERLKRSFHDMDQMIVEKTGRSIPEIFADDGECDFRALEGQMLAELCAGEEPVVIATGGGVVLSAPNRKRMQDSGYVIWLDVPPEIAAERIRGDSNRPLLLGVDALQKARELDHKRRNIYASIAEYQVHTDQLEPEAAVEGIIGFLENYA